MIIHGLQKMTLLDYPGKVACTVFLGGCDFRCPFCHNSELLDISAPAETDDARLMEFLKKRTGLLDGVCFTGGEPLLRHDLKPLIEEIRTLGYSVKIDTNGNHPDKLFELIDNGLADYIAMDIKNDPARYAETCGLESMDLSKIRESILMIMGKQKDYEFRTTVIDEFHDEDSFRAIGPWIRNAKRYFLQPFVDRDSVIYKDFHAPSKEKCEKYAEIIKEFVPAVQIRGID